MFTTISDALITVGKAIKREIFTTIKDNLDDHEERIAGFESFGGRVDVFNNDVLMGSVAGSLNELAFYRATSSFTLTNCEIQIFEKNGVATGSLEVDILKNTTPNDTGMTSIFNTKPSIDFSTASDYQVSSNQVFNSAQTEMSAGEILRLDVTSLPNNISKFRIVLFGEV